MGNQISLGLGAGLLTMALGIIYFTQVRNDSITSKTYRLLIYSTLYAAFAQYPMYFLLKSYGNNLLIAHFVTKLYWINGFFFFLNFYTYITAFVSKEGSLTSRNILNKKLTKVVITISSLFLLAFLLSPVKVFNNEGIIEFINIPVLITLANGAVIAIISLIYAFIHRSMNKKAISKIIIYSFILLVGTLIFQLLEPTLLCVSVGMVSLLYMLYFVFENPDLYVIDKLSDLQKQVEESKNSKTDVLSNMSKEIKTPINNISANASEILNRNLSVDESKKIINEITNEGNNLLEIIEHILDISTLTNGSERVNENEYSIGNILKELENSYSFKVNKKDIKFKINIAPNIPNELYGDSSKVKQILNNIISNAIKYTDYGRIQIDVSCDTAGSLTNLHFVISDTGIGIKNEDKGNVYSSSTNENSNGLGLAITKIYIEQLNGKIRFDSTYLAGTIFYIDIPQEVRDPNPITFDETEVTDEPIYQDFNKQRVIIVDEDPLNRKVLIKLLTNYNFDIDEAESGIECLNKIKQGNVYDLIFIDHQMAGLDGIEVLIALNKLKQFFNIPPIVMTTANAASGKRSYYLNYGFDEYLAKPITILSLNKIIRKLVKTKDKRGYEVSELNFEDTKTEEESVYSEEFTSVINEDNTKSVMEEIKIPEITEEEPKETVEQEDPFVTISRDEKRELDADFPASIKLHDLSEKPKDTK